MNTRLESPRNPTTAERAHFEQAVRHHRTPRGGIDSSGRLWDLGGDRSGHLGVGSGTTMATKPVRVGIHLT